MFTVALQHKTNAAHFVDTTRRSEPFMTDFLACTSPVLCKGSRIIVRFLIETLS